MYVYFLSMNIEFFSKNNGHTDELEKLTPQDQGQMAPKNLLNKKETPEINMELIDFLGDLSEEIKELKDQCDLRRNGIERIRVKIREMFGKTENIEKLLIETRILLQTALREAAKGNYSSEELENLQGRVRHVKDLLLQEIASDKENEIGSVVDIRRSHYGKLKQATFGLVGLSLLAGIIPRSSEGEASESIKTPEIQQRVEQRELVNQVLSGVDPDLIGQIFSGDQLVLLAPEHVSDPLKISVEKIQEETPFENGQELAFAQSVFFGGWNQDFVSHFPEGAFRFPGSRITPIIEGISGNIPYVPHITGDIQDLRQQTLTIFMHEAEKEVHEIWEGGGISRLADTERDEIVQSIGSFYGREIQVDTGSAFLLNLLSNSKVSREGLTFLFDTQDAKSPFSRFLKDVRRMNNPNDSLSDYLNLDRKIHEAVDPLLEAVERNEQFSRIEKDTIKEKLSFVAKKKTSLS